MENQQEQINAAAAGAKKPKVKKERLDVLLVSRGLAPSREKAKALIMSGNVLVNEEREDKVEYLQNNTENRYYRK